MRYKITKRNILIIIINFCYVFGMQIIIELLLFSWRTIITNAYCIELVTC